MLAHSPSTSRTGTVGLGLPEAHTAYSEKDEELAEAESQVYVSPDPAANAPPKGSYFEEIVNSYGAVSWIFGFNEKYSLLLLIFFGGALIGFCLARTIMMNPANLRHLTVPGEWFWYRQSLYKPCIFIHVYLSIISGIFAVPQFIPAIRRRAFVLHRINGYLTISLLIPSTVCGSIVARRAFGGELNVQSSFYVDGFLIVFSALMGITNVKRTRRHRKWMLRTVAYAAVPATARITSICARRIISKIGSYFALWRCDEISFVLGNDILQQSYPQCTQIDGVFTRERVAIRAAFRGNGLAAVKGDELAFASSVRVTWGMSMWIAMVIHILGVEIYIRLTESSNQHRRGNVLQRSDKDTEGDRNGL